MMSSKRSGLSRFKLSRMPGAFQLEHADRVRLCQDLEALTVVEGERGEIDVDVAPALDEIDGLLEHRERLQAEEVELHEPRGLDHLPVVLGDWRIRLRIARQRHQLLERPVGDHHAGSMRGGVAIEAFELLGDLQQARDHRLAVALLLQLRLAVDGFRQRDGIGGVVRHQLAQPVDLSVRHLQHAADVAEHRARLQLAVRDDLRHAVVPVLIRHVADHLVAAVLAEVDVEVGHRYALGVQEALKQQPEAQRIEVGDGERPGDNRAGARAAAGTDRDPLRLRPLDEVGDDQEVAGELHARDDVDLVGEPLLVVGYGEARRGRSRGKAVAQSLLGLAAQLGRLAPRLLGLADDVVTGDETRQDRLAALGPEGAAARDFDGIVERFGQVGEDLRHRFGALEVVLTRHPPAIVLDDVAAVRDAQQRIVRLVVVGAREVGFVGGNDRNPERIGELQELRLDIVLALEAVALDLDVEAVAERRSKPLQPLLGKRLLSLPQRAVDGPVGTASERDQPIGLGRERADRGVHRIGRGGFQMRPAHDLHHVGVAGLARRKQRDRAVPRAALRRHPSGLLDQLRLALREIDVQSHADDRLDAGLRELVGELERTEEVVGIGQAQRRQLVRRGELGELRDRQRTLEQRVRRMDLEVHEFRRRGRLSVGSGRRATRSVHAAYLDHGAAAPKG